MKKLIRYDNLEWPAREDSNLQPTDSKSGMRRFPPTSQRLVRYELKTSYRDGTTHVFFETLDLMARLAALIPKPRVNLIRYHGVFAPNSPHRAAGPTRPQSARFDARQITRTATCRYDMGTATQARVQHRHQNL